MSIQIIEVSNSSLLGEFIRFPYRHYRSTRQWLPPLLTDERKFYHPAKNKAYAYCDSVRFLARKDSITCGRIMGIIHHPYNKITGQDTARFFAYECTDDTEAASALLEAVETWARSKEIHRMVGPFGFSDKDPQGLLISGYEHNAVLTTPYNPPYYVSQLEEAGYRKELDLVEYHIPVPVEVPEFYRRISERALRNSKVHCLEFRRKRQLKPFIVPVLGLMNETFGEIYGYNPLTDEEMHSLAREYLPVLDPEFIKVVMSGMEPVGFIIGMPDIGPGLRKAWGRLYPLGIFHVLRDMKRSDYLVLLVGAIRRDFQGIGLDAVLGSMMMASAIKRGMKTINSHLEMESNYKVRAEMERAGGKISKVYRVFRKDL